MTTTTTKPVSPKAQVHAPASIAGVLRRDTFGNVAPQALWRHEATGVVCARFAGKVFPASFTAGVIAIDHTAAPVGAWLRENYVPVKNLEFLSKAERAKLAKADAGKAEAKVDRQQQRIADAVARILARAGATEPAPAKAPPAKAPPAMDVAALVEAAMVELRAIEAKPAAATKRGRGRPARK
jgi:hypothetical protein